MAKQQHFYSSLQGRRITPIPVRTQPNYHMHDDLPQGMVYLIHTVYVDSDGTPTMVGERIDVTNEALSVVDAAETFKNAPQSATVPIHFLGAIWELLP